MTDLTETLDGIFDPADSTIAPGGVVAVRWRGEVIYRRGYGMASIEHGVANRPTTRMRIGSSSKQFTCFAAMLLAEDGRLDLDAPVDRWIEGLPGFPTVPTARQLMNHTGGYRDHLDAAGIANGGAKIPDGWAMQSILRQTGANYSPAMGQTYCNAGYHLLSHVIDTAAEEPFEQFLSRRIFEPLGMTATQSAPSDYVITPDMATLHVPDPSGGWRRGLFPTEEIRGEGAMVSTVDDLLLWLDELNGPHKLASESAWQEMKRAPALPDANQSIYALGLYVQNYRGIDIIHHAGAVIGGAAQIMTAPAHDLDIVMLSNGGALQPIPTVFAILEAVLEGSLAQELSPLAKVADYSSLDGTYYGAEDGTLVGFAALGDTLGISFVGNPPMPVLRDQGEALTVEFHEAALGPLVLETSGVMEGDDPPRDLAFSESGVSKPLRLLGINSEKREAICRDLIGSYHCSDLEAHADLSLDEKLLASVHGEFGSTSGFLELLSEDLLLVTDPEAGYGSASIQLVRTDGEVSGFRISAPRGRGFLFMRVP